MTIDLADPGLAALEPRAPALLTGEGAALLLEQAARVAEGAAQGRSAPTLQQALAQSGGCGCGGRGPEAILDVEPRPGPAEVDIPRELERGYSRVTDHLGDRGSALWLLHAEAPLPPAPEPEAPAPAPTKDVSLRAASTEEEAIIVEGKRLEEEDEPGMPGSTNEGGDPTLGGGDTGMGGGGYGEVHPWDVPTVAYEVTDSQNTEAVLKAKDALEGELVRLTKLITALDDNARIELKDGTVILGWELKWLWSSMSFMVTDRAEYATSTRGGAVLGGLSLMHFTTVLDWKMSDAEGLSFIIMHELIHMSWPGIEHDRLQQSEFLARPDSQTTPYDENQIDFVENEQYANYGARAVLNTLGLTYGGTPTHGY